MEQYNEEGITALYNRAEDCRKNANIALSQDRKDVALIYATLYLAENQRIANFLTEMRIR